MPAAAHVPAAACDACRPHASALVWSSISRCFSSSCASAAAAPLSAWRCKQPERHVRCMCLRRGRGSPAALSTRAPCVQAMLQLGSTQQGAPAHRPCLAPLRAPRAVRGAGKLQGIHKPSQVGEWLTSMVESGTAGRAGLLGLMPACASRKEQGAGATVSAAHQSTSDTCTLCVVPKLQACWPCCATGCRAPEALLCAAITAPQASACRSAPAGQQ